MKRQNLPSFSFADCLFPDCIFAHTYSFIFRWPAANSKSIKKESLTLVEWEKQVGDDVEEDETIAIIETDKVAGITCLHAGLYVCILLDFL